MQLWTALIAVLAVGLPSWPPPDAAQEKTSAYRAVVEEYRGTMTGAVEQIGAASARDVRSWVDQAVADRSGVWDRDALRAAAILHTECWYLAASRKQYESGAEQLEAATRLFARLLAIAPDQIEYIDRWRRTVAGLLPALANPGQAEEFAARTAPLFPISLNRELALRAFLDGLAAERKAAEPTSRFGRTISPDNTPLRWWAAATNSYRSALKNDPTFELAALHLGRVRMLQGEVDDASRYFEQAAKGDDPRVRYLALLFVGSIAERTGRFEQAERSYLDAMSVYPFGQAWGLALSQLLSRTAREADARRVIERLARKRGSVVEPLWSYLPPAALTVTDHQIALDELRAEVRK